ncbi:hypothetical protein ABW19_dt0202256 [Dactylella cylindrospora]|nr:hypothetical protein ABW19_dt0202256 [Dactylella cylindrospora]
MPSTIPFNTDSAWLPTTSTTRHRRITGSMGFKQSLWLPLLLGGFLLPNVAQAAINLVYCSPENTGSDYDAYNFIWQSDGECYNHCVADYAYAIVQAKNCWCSNYTPTELKDLDDCSDACPGYPDDKCGNLELGYFNYIELPGHSPSSKTDGPASSTSQRSSSTDAPQTTRGPTPIISVTTILGSQMTITVTPTSTEPSGSSFPVNSDGNNDFFSNAGRVAGVFVGIFAFVLLLVGLIFFLRKRRKDRRKSVDSSDNPEMGMSGSGSPNLGTGSASPSNRPRSTSTLGFVGGFSQEKNVAVATSGFAETDRVTDQRLDPNQIWMRFDNDNGSRVSLRSLQDNHDYSRRVLKVHTVPED